MGEIGKSTHHHHSVQAQIVFAKVEETTEMVGRSPCILRDKIASALLIVGQSHEFKGMVVGSLQAFESLLALLLRDRMPYFGRSSSEIEAGRGDIALPIDGSSAAQATHNELHQRVERQVEHTVGIEIVGHFEHELSAKSMVGEARYGLIFTATAHTMCEFSGRIVGPKHVNLLAGKVTYGSIENGIGPLIEGRKRMRCAGGLLQSADNDVVVGRFGMIGVVGAGAISLQQGEQTGAHATQVDGARAAREVITAHTLGEQAACHVVDAQVDRVTLHQMIGLDGGQHGVGPAERTAVLLLHGRGFEQQVGRERVAGCAFQVARFGLSGSRTGRNEQAGAYREDKNFLHIPQSYKEID